MDQAFPPISAVRKGFREPARTYSLLLKREGGLGLQCPKTVCPPFKPSGSFWKLHFWSQQTKLHYLHYQLLQYIKLSQDSISSLMWMLNASNSLLMAFQNVTFPYKKVQTTKLILAFIIRKFHKQVFLRLHLNISNKLHNLDMNNRKQYKNNFLRLNNPISLF